ncbi:cellobiose dehydrogenase-like protein [Cadophora sp. MPI-SDFR-AT-0126]|nr:cellobiose dehydrogenase-like protein [Leotiomycetes sp. MPI-SDFR-AT-0126]
MSLVLCCLWDQSVYGQILSVPYCDPLTTICYSSYTNEWGISYRIALPDVAAAPSDAIIQIVAPTEFGWAAFAWGGTMVWNPLTMGWSNGTGAVVSSRFAYGLSQPTTYDAAEYFYLRGTGTNSTHWTLTTLCRGCTAWSSNDESIASINYTGTSHVACAQAKAPVVDPTDNATAFNYHDSFSKWEHDIKAARSPLFDTWVKANLLSTDTSTAPSSTASPTSTIPATSALPPTTSASPTKAVPTHSTLPVPTACPGVPIAKYEGMTAGGWRATKVKGGMGAARGVIVDSAGNLLVVESGKGITAHTVGNDGCITSSKIIVPQRSLSHGIALGANGTTLYASSMTSVWSWTYDPKAIAVVGSSKTIISGMSNSGHPSRTLVIPPHHPNLLLVSHGSGDNFDYPSGDVKTQRAVIKVFDMSAIPAAGYKFVTDGYQAGYGLRNEVGLAFDGNNMMWGVENGSDEIRRIVNSSAIDIHQDNPADELNYLGDVSLPNTNWYGYPTCYTVWKPSDFTDKAFAVGDQFVLAPNDTFRDETCTTKSVPARLAFQAHSAPLDAKFDSSFENLYIAFHGSWNRAPTTGYKVVAVPFTQADDGSYKPTAPSNSTTGYVDIWSNANVTSCGATSCFRPVGIAFDAFERMYITSDATAEGELWILGKV